ncbi:MAG TPA: hypothetical protein VJZ00_15090 [Thermoanaerobaculia bacterium]|nr:hypothetical protein [Thermoanaerobaculia bacterium]
MFFAFDWRDFDFFAQMDETQAEAACRIGCTRRWNRRGLGWFREGGRRRLAGIAAKVPLGSPFAGRLIAEKQESAGQ